MLMHVCTVMSLSSTCTFSHCQFRKVLFGEIEVTSYNTDFDERLAVCTMCITLISRKNAYFVVASALECKFIYGCCPGFI